MDIKADEISKIIREQIGSYAVDVDVAEVGSIISLGDGIARVHGIENAMAGEMLEFPHGVYGVALNLEEESVGAVLLGEFKDIKATPTGELIDDASWDRRRTEWLPSAEDGAFIASLMKPETALGQFANWISAPKVGIDNKPGDFEYVRIAA